MRIAAVGKAFPKHYHAQSEITARLQEIWGDKQSAVHRLDSLHTNAKVDGRYLAMPLAEYGRGQTFGEINDLWIATALDLGERAVRSALEEAGLEAADVDVIYFSTVTGIASPSIDARLVNRLGFRTDIKRVPMFGLGCVAGVAAISRAADYLRGHRGQIALVLTIELCSLTFQLEDRSVANLISTGLFGDGATAAVIVGDDCVANGPEILATESVFYPDTEHVMGWHPSEKGFQIVLSPEVPAVARELIPQDVDRFLRAEGLRREDIVTWICHPGGPRVLEALQDGLELQRSDLQLSWQTLARVGNLSSASVMLVLSATMAVRPRDGFGLMLAMGPGFCSELLLLKW